MSGVVVCFVLLLGSCGISGIEKYSSTKPQMDFKKFFDGKVIAHGALFDFFGRLDTRFIMRSEPVENTANDNKTVYQQSIEYVDTKKKKDIFSYAIFDNKNPSRFVYKDSMMVDAGVYNQSGSVAQVFYDLKIEREDGSVMVVSAKDTLYMIDENHAINKIKIKKFGIPVASVVMSLEKINEVSNSSLPSVKAKPSMQPKKH